MDTSLKQQIKQWEKLFQFQYSRKPNRKDIHSDPNIAELYQKYWLHKNGKAVQPSDQNVDSNCQPTLVEDRKKAQCLSRLNSRLSKLSHKNSSSEPTQFTYSKPKTIFSVTRPHHCKSKDRFQVNQNALNQLDSILNSDVSYTPVVPSPSTCISPISGIRQSSEQKHSPVSNISPATHQTNSHNISSPQSASIASDVSRRSISLALQPLAAHKDTALHEHIALHEDTALHEDADPHEDAVLHEDTALHEHTALHEDAVLHEDTTLHEDAVLHEDTALHEDTDPHEDTLQKSTISKKPRTARPKARDTMVSHNFVRLNLKRKYRGKRMGSRGYHGDKSSKYARLASKHRYFNTIKKARDARRNKQLYTELLEDAELDQYLRSSSDSDDKLASSNKKQKTSHTTECLPNYTSHTTECLPNYTLPNNPSSGSTAIINSSDFSKTTASTLNSTCIDTSFCDSMMIESCATDDKVESCPANGNQMQFDSVIADGALQSHLLPILKENFGFHCFYDGQFSAISRILQGKSTLFLSATGGGKSLCYQFPALMLRGLTLVVSPLLSLMQDQLHKLPVCLKGGTWNSTQDSAAVRQLITDVRSGALKVLFVSPEKLFNPGFQRVMSSLGSSGISFACVDEVHCVSEWSHNFRPTFMRLGYVLREVLHVSCILGLTATATRETQMSICQSLCIPHEGVVTAHLQRPNFYITVSKDRGKQSALVRLLRSPRFKKLSSIIIYVSRQKQADALSAYLNRELFDTASYHAGKRTEIRNQVQTAFMNNKLRIVVATIAFGMGLDKQDVRAVIHCDVPQSLEHYVQEIGRAGRDGQLCHCHCFIDVEDVQWNRKLILGDQLSASDVKYIVDSIFASKKAAAHVGGYVCLSISGLCKKLGTKQAVIETALSILHTHVQCLRVLSTVHNTACIRFHNQSPEVLTKQSEVIKHFVDNFQGANGVYNVNICQTANELKMVYSDVQRILMQLKANKEISIVWKKLCYIVQIQCLPVDNSSSRFADSVFHRMDLHIQSRLDKVDSIYSILQEVATPQFDKIPTRKPSTTHRDKLQTMINEYFNISPALRAELNSEGEEECDLVLVS